MVSNGTALEETFQSDERQSNGDDVLARRQPGGADALLFEGQSAEDGNSGVQRGPPTNLYLPSPAATNLASPEDAHMHRLVLQIDDANHFSETWTIQEKGQDTKQTFNFVKKK